MDLLFILGIIISGTACVVYVPISVHVILKYYRLRNHLVIKKHFSEIQLHLVAALFVLMVFLILLNLSTCGILPNDTLYWSLSPCVVTFALTATLLLWRSYMNYFTIQYSNAIDSDRWKQLVNPERTKDIMANHIWFIREKATYGNYKLYRPYIAMFTILNILIVASLQIAAIILHAEQTISPFILGIFGLTSIEVLCALSLVGYLYCKTPKYGDIFYVHQEMQWMAVLGVAGTVILVVMSVISMLLKSEEAVYFVTATSQFMWITLDFLCILTQTAYVMHKNKQWLVEGVVSTIESELDESRNGNIQLESNKAIQNAMSAIPVKSSLTIDPMEPVPERSYNSIRKGSNAEDRRGTLEDVLRCENGFDSLFFHLNREFSTEVLLSLLEMTQFKELVLEAATERGIARAEWKGEVYEYLEYPLRSKKIPKSHIVHGEIDDELQKRFIDGIGDADKRSMAELFVRAHCLYARYIRKDSKLEVNISWPVRTELTKTMDDISVLIRETLPSFGEARDAYIFLFGLFDECLNQNQGLLRNSFLRYTQGLLYRDWFRVWSKEQPQ